MSELTAGTSRIGETVMGSQWRLWLGRGLVAAIGMVLLHAVWTLYLSGEPVLGALIFACTLGFVLFFGMRRFYSMRFIYPGMVAILLFGGATIKQFIAILLIGLLSGTYSSIFTAVPLLVSWEKGELPFVGRRA